VVEGKGWGYQKEKEKEMTKDLAGKFLLFLFLLLFFPS